MTQEPVVPPCPQQYSLSPLCWDDETCAASPQSWSFEHNSTSKLLRMADSSRSKLSLLITSFSFLSLCCDSLGVTTQLSVIMVSQTRVILLRMTLFFFVSFFFPVDLWLHGQCLSYKLSKWKAYWFRKKYYNYEKIIPHVDKPGDVELIIPNPIKHTTARWVEKLHFSSALNYHIQIFLLPRRRKKKSRKMI